MYIKKSIYCVLYLQNIVCQNSYTELSYLFNVGVTIKNVLIN